MPSYSWTCHVCEHRNQPNKESCESCGFPAIASGTEIERARTARSPISTDDKSMTSALFAPQLASESAEPIQMETASRGLSIGQALLIVFFGLYLLFGAYVTWRDTEWPIFMPPQLDVFGLLLGVFGNPVGAYLGAAFLALLGIACILIAFFL